MLCLNILSLRVSCNAYTCSFLWRHVTILYVHAPDIKTVHYILFLRLSHAPQIHAQTTRRVWI